MSKMSLSIPNLKYGNQTTKLGPIVQSKYTLTQIRANKRSVWQVLLLCCWYIEYTIHMILAPHFIPTNIRRLCVLRILYEHHLKIKKILNTDFTLERNSKQGFMNSRFNWFKNAFLCLENIHKAYSTGVVY